jgi:hypothetical protein
MRRLRPSTLVVIPASAAVPWRAAHTAPGAAEVKCPRQDGQRPGGPTHARTTPARRDTYTEFTGTSHRQPSLLRQKRRTMRERSPRAYPQGRSSRTSSPALGQGLPFADPLAFERTRANVTTENHIDGSRERPGHLDNRHPRHRRRSGPRTYSDRSWDARRRVDPATGPRRRPWGPS